MRSVGISGSTHWYGETVSANNYDICPLCKKRADEGHAEKVKRCAESYGRVSAGEYGRLMQEVDHPEKLGRSLQEYYELGIDEGGKFLVTYSATCDTCGFVFRYRHEERLDVEKLRNKRG